MARPKKIFGVSPKGIAVYPHLNEADFKFKKEFGEYTVKLRVDPEEAANIIATCETMAEAKLAEAKAEALENATTAKQRKDVEKFFICEDKPYSMEEDQETGEETGDMLLVFKANAGGKGRKGDTYTRSLTFFDAGRKVIKNVPAIWGGSELRVKFSYMPWHMPKIGAGVKLAIEAIQILDLVTSGGSANADGFDDEDGYEADDSAPAPASDTSGDTDDAPEGDDF